MHPGYVWSGAPAAGRSAKGENFLNDRLSYTANSKHFKALVFTYLKYTCAPKICPKMSRNLMSIEVLVQRPTNYLTFEK